MSQPDLNGVRVLVVEDDTDCREFMRTVLELEGATVVTAETAWHALKVLGKFVPHVIVSDLVLPDEDGVWLIRTARAAMRLGTRAPATVIVTGSTDKAARTRCFLAGCDEFLPKPLDAIELCNVVARLAAPSTPSPPRRDCSTNACDAK
ncbi:MAG TPA: response regulator [Methylomirabilota bacterium]|jgi:CheY-like chemotaxis protein